MSCEICQEIPLIPLQLSCDHQYCFLCLAKGMLDGIMSCPSCHSEFNYKKIDSENRYLWLYSSCLSDNWWCYDKDQNVQIEEAYQAYKDDNVEIKIPISIKLNSSKIITTTLKQLPNQPSFQSFNISDPDDVCVDFTDDTNPPKKMPPSDIIDINGTDYKLDFANMKQMNTKENWKKRDIKRIVIPSELFKMDSIIYYLKYEKDVNGIAGTKF
jgi:hypothetical protein